MVRRQDPNWDPAAAPGARQRAGRAGEPRHVPLHQRRAPALRHEPGQGAVARPGGLHPRERPHQRLQGLRVHRPGEPRDDPEIKPGVLLPREFWKLVVMVDADRQRLHATAYLLSQGDLIRELLENRGRTEANEGFVLGAYRTFQIAVARPGRRDRLRPVGLRRRRPAGGRPGGPGGARTCRCSCPWSAARTSAPDSCGDPFGRRRWKVDAGPVRPPAPQTTSAPC